MSIARRSARAICNANGLHCGVRYETESLVTRRGRSHWLLIRAAILLSLCVVGFLNGRRVRHGCYSNKDSLAKHGGRHGAALSGGGGIVSPVTQNTSSTHVVSVAIATVLRVGRNPSVIYSPITLGCDRWWNLCCNIGLRITGIAFWRSWTLRRGTSARCRLRKRFASLTRTFADSSALLNESLEFRGASMGFCGAANSGVGTQTFTLTESMPGRSFLSATCRAFGLRFVRTVLSLSRLSGRAHSRPRSVMR